jgi:hypothetical protein
MVAKKEKRKKKNEKRERWQDANQKPLDLFASVVLNGQKKNGNHEGVMDTSIHPCPCKVYK